MPVVIGKKPDHDFHNPVGMLSDCHRRIERFLDVLVRLAADGAERPLESAGRTALEASLKYFREAAPLHTSDEEDSLFPRLRAVEDERVLEAMAQIDRLEADHRVAGPLHEEVDTLGRRWLEGPLDAVSAARLKDVTEQLSRLYLAHIALEDSTVFPLAASVLGDAAKTEVGREMAGRRDVPFLPSGGRS